jgi:hypothetical protein
LKSSLKINRRSPSEQIDEETYNKGQRESKFIMLELKRLTDMLDGTEKLEKQMASKATASVVGKNQMPIMS